MVTFIHDCGWDEGVSAQAVILSTLHLDKNKARIWVMGCGLWGSASSLCKLPNSPDQGEAAHCHLPSARPAPGVSQQYAAPTVSGFTHIWHVVSPPQYSIPHLYVQLRLSGAVFATQI